MNKVEKIIVLMLAALVLAGCSQKAKKETTRSSSSKSTGDLIIKKNKPHKVGHLTSNDLSPQKTVSVVMAYAGIKFSNEWGNALKQARENGLKVDLKNQSDFSYMNEGSGVAYMVTDDLGYTLKQVDNDNQIFLYANKKEIAQATMTQMVDYLNHNDGENVVNELATKATVNDKRDSDSSDETSSTKKSNLPGDAGVVNVPKNLQGTWYSYVEGNDKLDTVTFSEHKFSGADETLELHKIDDKFFNTHDYGDMSKAYHKATEKWGMASLYTKPTHGIYWLNIRSWMQGAGDGEYYGAYTEKGQSVMITAHGAGQWVDR